MPLRTASHARTNTSLTAAAERRLLVWIAARLPPWITSDRLTSLELAAMTAVTQTIMNLDATVWKR